MAGDLLSIDVVPTGATAVLVLWGAIDLASSGALATCIESLDPGWRRVVLDMEGVSLLDSSGIAVLARAIRHRGRVLEIRHASRTVQRVLELTGLHELVDMT